jgi:hypothetical protein
MPDSGMMGREPPSADRAAAAALAAVILAGRRDLGAGVLARSQSAKARTRLLGGPVIAASRLELRRHPAIAALINADSSAAATCDTAPGT